MTARAPQWYRSFYWRIGLSFAVLVVVVLAAQSAMFGYLMRRTIATFPSRIPNNFASSVASDLDAALTEDPALDLQQFVSSHYRGNMFQTYVVMRDGQIAANAAEPLADDLRRLADALLAGSDLMNADHQPIFNAAVVTAPIQVGGELRGIVVLPPFPPRALGNLAQLLSVPGTLLLIVATMIAAAVIFAPA